MTVRTLPGPELHLKSTVGELQLFDAQVTIDTPARTVMEFFEQHPAIPGIIITENSLYTALLSRKEFFECISKPYSLELYLKRPIRVMIESIPYAPRSIVQHSTPIVDAVQVALQRSEEHFTDPLVVENSNHSLRILDVHQLLRAHAHIHALAVEQLREINQFKSELLGIASHDLKNPLNSIINLAKVIQSELPPDAAFASEMAEQILGTSQHMLHLVLELLNSSVIETGRLELKRSICDLRDIVAAIVWQNRAQAESKQQTIEYTAEEEESFVINGDAVKLRESMENLVSNAIKYSPQGRHIRVDLSRNSESVRFAVHDQGPGLTAEDRQRLFGKFQRLSAQPTGGESSTGLGLYIARQIVELHEGKIWVESTVGVGSSFFIEIPACDIFADTGAAMNGEIPKL